MMMMVEKMMIENDDDDGCKNEKSPPLFSRGLFYFVFFVFGKTRKEINFFLPPFCGKVTLRARKKKKNN
jgi:hypothetical protein